MHTQNGGNGLCENSEMYKFTFIIVPGHVSVSGNVSDYINYVSVLGQILDWVYIMNIHTLPGKTDDLGTNYDAILG